MKIVKETRSIFIGIIIGLLLAVPVISLASVGDKVTAIFSTFNFIVNGEQKTLEADPLVYQGSTYLPVKVVSNMLGYDVTYKADSRTIELEKSNLDFNGLDSVTNEADFNHLNEEQLFVSFNDIYKLKNDERFIVSSVVHGEHAIKVLDLNTVNDNTIYIAKINIDCIESRNEEETYYSTTFLLQFLTQEEIINLPKKKVKDII